MKSKGHFSRLALLFKTIIFFLEILQIHSSLYFIVWTLPMIYQRKANRLEEELLVLEGYLSGLILSVHLTIRESCVEWLCRNPAYEFTGILANCLAGYRWNWPIFFNFLLWSFLKYKMGIIMILQKIVWELNKSIFIKLLLMASSKHYQHLPSLTIINKYVTTITCINWYLI